jgi:hypothetical protein
VKHWVLKIELDGEWEQCVFGTREEALTAFAALAGDYRLSLRRALLLLIGSEADFANTSVEGQTNRGYVN